MQGSADFGVWWLIIWPPKLRTSRMLADQSAERPAYYADFSFEDFISYASEASP